MTNPVKVESAASRVEQAKRLIQEASLARMQSLPPVLSIQAQIDLTRRASEAAAGLARLIAALDAHPHSADRSSPEQP